MLITDQNNNRIRTVSNTQGPELTLYNVSTAYAGSYQVIVTNSAGTASSERASLTVATSPQIWGTARNPDETVSLLCVSRPGSTVVYYATGLQMPVNWLPLSTNLAGADGSWQFTDSIGTEGSRFYRYYMQ